MSESLLPEKRLSCKQAPNIPITAITSSTTTFQITNIDINHLWKHNWIPPSPKQRSLDLAMDRKAKAMLQRVPLNWREQHGWKTRKHLRNVGKLSSTAFKETNNLSTNHPFAFFWCFAIFLYIHHNDIDILWYIILYFEGLSWYHICPETPQILNDSVKLDPHPSLHTDWWLVSMSINPPELVIAPKPGSLGNIPSLEVTCETWVCMLYVKGN